MGTVIMKKLSIILFFAGLLLLFGSHHAMAAIAEGPDFGRFTTFVDMDTGYIWLDLDNFNDYNWDTYQMVAEAEANGFTFANYDHVVTLLNSLPLHSGQFEQYKQIMGYYHYVHPTIGDGFDIIWGSYKINSTYVGYAYTYRNPVYDDHWTYQSPRTWDLHDPKMNIWAYRKELAIIISPPSAMLTKSGPVTYGVTYIGADTVTLTAANVKLNKTGTANGTVAVSGTGKHNRAVTISNITGNGTLGISIQAGTACDNSGKCTAAAGPSETFDVVNINFGDVDGSAAVDLRDAVLVLQIIAGAASPGAKIDRTADVNGDDKIAMEEAIYILQKIAQLRH